MTIVVNRASLGEALTSEFESAAGSTISDPEVVMLLAHAQRTLEEEEGARDVMASPQDAMTAAFQSFLETRARDGRKYVGATAGGYEAKFDSKDLLGWAGSFFTWWRGIKRHDFLEAPAEPEPLSNRCRVAVLSDWGTNLYGAPECANSIKRDGDYQMVLHLGDIYYSGTAEEVEQRFLAPWPSVEGARNRALNGNHEMYTGGKAYFEQILRDHRFDQPASYFAAQNDHWLLVGLDTAYEDHDLHGSQVAWLERLVAQSGNRKVVLFSHHQPYSLFEKQGVKLIHKLRPLLEREEIFAWYWGHEHRCLLYEPHPNWPFRGRCIGHSGMPFFRDKVLPETPDKPGWRLVRRGRLLPTARLLDGPNQYIEGHETEYYPNGYVTLEFDGDELVELVHNPDGTPLWQETLE